MNTAAVPKTMKAEVIERFGPPHDVMHTAVVPIPELDDHEILIDVRSAGVGVWDPELCKGEFGAEAGLPRVLGSDGSGIVVALGAQVEGFEMGDRVYGYGFMNPKGGFYAEYAVVSENEAAKVPDKLSLDQAGALAADGLTALAGLDTVDLRRGNTLLIFGASGGIGHLALQLAKRMGARVLAIASGHDGVELVSRLGADAALEGHSNDVLEKARAFAPGGVDAALVLAGGADALLELVRQDGIVAYPHGVEPGPRDRRGVMVQAYDGYHGREALERLNRLVAMEPFFIVVSRIYALEETPNALTEVTRHHLGKFAVMPRRF